jgi:hypothetical protein
LNIFEIGSNCSLEFIDPKKIASTPNNFYDEIARRQSDLIQKQHEALIRQRRFESINELPRKTFNAPEPGKGIG